MKQALVIDDHPIVRKGIRELLQGAFPFIDIHESSGGEGVVEELCGSSWAFVLLDINLVEKNGLEILKRTNARRRGLPIIVFSLHSETQYAARAFRAGAVAYVSKTSPPEHLLETVRAVLEGSINVKTVRDTGSQPIAAGREGQVLRLLVKGMTRKEISRTLGVKESTVSTYKTRLIRKFDVQNQAELVRYAVQEGLLR
jgi:DNA-binding NarL/FixJ family response regulator